MPQKRSAVDKVWKSDDIIGLKVTVKSDTGKSIHAKDVKVTRANYRYFMAGPEKIRKVKQELKEAGFKVLGESRIGVTIAGPKKLVEKYFNAAIKVRTVTFPHGREKRKIRQPDGRLEVPKKLKDLVDKVSFEQYPIPLESADPPEVDYYHLNVPDDIAAILNADEVQPCGTDGSGIKAAVLDDGFFEHAYYAANGYDITLHPVGADDMPEGKGHGTAISTNLLAVAPGVELHVFNSQILIFSVAQAAFQAAKDEGVDVISCSWGMSSYDADLAWEIVDAVESGITVVFACGNGGPVYFPGCMDEVISVGGVYPEEGGGLHASTYASSGECDSNPGRQCPDVSGLVGDADHGVLIMMPTVPDGTYDNSFADYDNTATDDGWLCGSGTSSACPQVAGAAALMLQCNPALTPEQIKTLLEDTATDVTVGSSASGEPAGPGVDLATGAGLIDVAAAVAAAGCECGGGCGTYLEHCLSKNELCMVTREFCVRVLENTCLLRREVCIHVLEGGGGCLPKMEGIICHPQLEFGPQCFPHMEGGCGPREYIIPDNLDPGYIDPLRDMKPVIRNRLSRSLSRPTAGTHVRKLTTRRKKKLTSRGGTARFGIKIRPVPEK